MPTVKLAMWYRLQPFSSGSHHRIPISDHLDPGPTPG